jgi:circadian clock protein KaiB
MTQQKKSARRSRDRARARATAAVEKLIDHQPSSGHYVLRLYVAGSTPRSAQSVANIQSLCEERLAGHYDLEVIDIYQQPREAVNEQVVAVPMLVKKLPEPVRRMVGDLSRREKVLVALDLQRDDGVVNAGWAAV